MDLKTKALILTIILYLVGLVAICWSLYFFFCRPFYSSIFAAVSWFSYYFILRLYLQTVKWKKSNIPFLRPVFLIGHKYFLNVFCARAPLVAVLDRIYHENKNKDVVGFFFGTQPVILVQDVKLIQQIFVKNSDKTFCSTFAPLSDDIETQSTIPMCSDKNRWRAGRSTLAPMFAMSRMKGAQFEKFEKLMSRMLNYSEETFRSNQPLPIGELAYNFILDSAAWWHFDEYTNSFVEKSAMHDSLEEYFSNSCWGQLRTFLAFACPFLQRFGFGKFKPVRPVPRLCFDNMRSLLESRLKNWKDPMRQYNFVDYLGSLKEKGEFANKKGMQHLNPKTQNELILRQMTGYAWTMLMAGVEGPGLLAVFTIHLLSLYPEYQDKIKEEIDQAMKNRKVSELTFDVMQDLRFTEQCVYEAARLIPNLPFLARRCSEDFEVSDTNYTFRKGDLIMVCTLSINHDPKNFENPEKFHPERFNSVKNWSSITSDVLLSFGLGPRKCPGYTIGVTFIVMFVASLLSKYQIKPRSHLKQMTTPADFTPKLFTNMIKGDLLVDLILR